MCIVGDLERSDVTERCCALKRKLPRSQAALSMAGATTAPQRCCCDAATPWAAHVLVLQALGAVTHSREISRHVGLTPTAKCQSLATTECQELPHQLARMRCGCDAASAAAAPSAAAGGRLQALEAACQSECDAAASGNCVLPLRSSS